jgi:hypothetical protein
VRQRQPPGAELLETGVLQIDDAPRDHQVRVGIAVVESPALVMN